MFPLYNKSNSDDGDDDEEDDDEDDDDANLQWHFHEVALHPLSPDRIRI